MVKKKVDPRVRGLIVDGVRKGHRSLIVLVGDHGKDQVFLIHSFSVLVTDIFICGLGRESSQSFIQNKSKSQTLSIMVLQKGAGLQHTSAKKNQRYWESAQEWVDMRYRL